MQTQLLELYTMDKSNRASFLDSLPQEELNAILLDASKCIEAIQELEPMYKTLKKFENKFSSLILNIWWLINRKAKEKTLSEYNSVREKALSLWKNPEISLEKLLDVETASILAQYSVSSWNKETNSVVDLALTIIKQKMINEVNPYILAKFPD